MTRRQIQTQPYTPPAPTSPQHIRLFAAYQGDELLAGVLIFQTDQVARTQYIANNLQGRDLGALDFLFDHLIHNVYPQYYFSLGSSLDPASETLNQGLLDQKEGFGGRTISQFHYTWQL